MNSLSYHESHSHGPLRSSVFRHSLRKILTGNTLCHITGMKKWNFYMSQKEVWCCVPRTVPGCFRKDISILLIPAHCTDCLETVRFPTIMLWFSGWICWIFSRQIPARPLIWYLFAPENICFPMARISLRSSLIRLVHWSKKAADEYRNCDTSLTAALSIKITLLQILELLFASQSFIPGTQTGEPSGDGNPLKAVFSYIESHYGEKIISGRPCRHNSYEPELFLPFLK